MGTVAYEAARARSGRAGTIELILKSYEVWGCQSGHLANLGDARLPQAPPVATSLAMGVLNFTKDS